jgi:uncharacterized protein YndB with AHSA1/START domain
MKTKNHVARAEITIYTSAKKVWQALTDPEIIRKYMFGAEVRSEWEEGSKIIWEGQWQDKQYKDKGKILELSPNKRLQYSHFTPLSGEEEVPENYHIVTIDLTEDDNHTVVSLKQDNNHTEVAKEHAEKNWRTILRSLKTILEQNN